MSRLIAKFCGSRGSDPKPIFPAGIKVLSAGKDPVVDVCFVHGLTGDWERTWTAEGQKRPWPETLLSPELPDARILTFGYDAYIVRKGVASRNGLNDHAINFVHSLAGARVSCEKRPLILVAHSMGGLICKKMLLLSRESPEPRFKRIADATIGVAFLGTPHLGASKAAWAKVPIAALGILKSRNVKVIDVLCADDEFLEDIRDRFVRTFLHHSSANGPLEVACFFEELPVLGVGIIVDRKSATLGGNLPFSVHANHMEMVKFATAAEPGFRQLLSDLTRWTQAARPRNPGGASPMSPEDVSCYTEQCQKSLQFDGMEKRAGDIRLAAEGTCEWLFQNPEYLAWSTNGRGLFWIKGNPGSGKSTLLKHAYIHRQKIGDGLLLSFFFHDRGGELQKTPLGFYRSLAYQLLCTLPTSVVDLIDVYQKNHALQPNAPINIGDWVWTEEDLQHYIQRAITKILNARAVWLFVDALDEVGKENAVAVFEWFQSLRTVTTDSRFPFRLCVSCRPYPVVAPQNAFVVIVEKENARDINAYVQQQLQNKFDRHDVSTADIFNLIVSRANGIFLWARLVVENVMAALRDGKSPSAVRKVVNDMPGKVSELYERMILAMQGDREGLELLQWVAFAMDPLSLGALRWALAVPPDCQHTSLEHCDHVRDMRDLNAMALHVRTASRGLVEISVPLQTDSASLQTGQEPVVQFIHQTAKEYVLGTGLAALHGGGLSPAEIAWRAHAHLTKICLQHLAKDELKDRSNLGKYPFPFFAYAIHYWVDHLRLANCNCPSDGHGDCTHVADYRAFLRLLHWPSNDVFARWEVLTVKSLGWSAGPTLLHILACTSSVSLLRVLFQQTPHINVDPLDFFDNTPLSLAATSGDEKTVRLFLDKGADPHHTDKQGYTVLMHAARARQEAVARLLIEEKQVDVDQADGHGNTLLSEAAAGGDEAMVRLLLEYDAQPNLANKKGVVPLLRATRNQEGADPNHANEVGTTGVLQAAAVEAVVRLLLKKGANPDCADNDGYTPLMLAACAGNEAVVRLLLQHGASPNVMNKDGKTALSYAIGAKHNAVEELLREAGGVVSSQPVLSDV